MLRLNSGNVINENVHKIGVVALGSFLENHGTLLPIDTDIKIASYISLKSCLLTGAKFLGVVIPSTEFNYIKHGIHNQPEDIIDYLKFILSWAKKIGIEKVIIVNCHGGNLIVENYLKTLENNLNIKIYFMSFPLTHASTEEVSIGKVLGIVKGDIEEHLKCPEVGFIGFKEARKINKDIDREAQKVEKEGVRIDENLGKELLNKYINKVVEKIILLSSHNYPK